MIFSPMAVVGISSPCFLTSSSIISFTVRSMVSRFTGRFLASFIDTGDKLAPVEGFVAAVALEHPEIVPLDFLVSGKTMLASEALPPATDDRLILDGA